VRARPVARPASNKEVGAIAGKERRNSIYRFQAAVVPASITAKPTRPKITAAILMSEISGNLNVHIGAELDSAHRIDGQG
jgi:hypothetical protein